MKRECPMWTSVMEARKANGWNGNIDNRGTGRQWNEGNYRGMQYNQNQYNQAPYNRYNQGQRFNQRPRRNSDGNSNIQVRFFEGINGTLNQQKARLQMMTQRGEWQDVKGSLDSGASATVAGWQKHGHMIVDVEDPRYDRYVELPDKTTKKIIKVGRMQIRAILQNGSVKTFQPLRVFLVDDVNWDWVLVGWNDLARHSATPEQALLAQA